MTLLMAFGEVEARSDGGYRLAGRTGSVSRRISSIPVQGGVAVKDLGTGEGTVEVTLTYHPALDNAPMSNLAQLGIWQAAMGEPRELSFGRLRYGDYVLESGTRTRPRSRHRSRGAHRRRYGFGFGSARLWPTFGTSEQARW